jgi:hypothetical protein
MIIAFSLKRCGCGKENPRFLLWEPETPDNRQRQLRDETSLAVTNPRSVAIKSQLFRESI